MGVASNLANIWNNVKEVDLRPIRQDALQVVKIALVGQPGAGRAELARQMRRDPSRPEVQTETPLQILTLDEARQLQGAHLVIVMIDAASEDVERYKDLTRALSRANQNVMVFVNHVDHQREIFGPWVDWGQKRVVYGRTDQTAFLLEEFVPAVIDLLPDKLTSLARHFPLFRVPVARHLINETAFSNAAYSLSTGLAEIVPVFDIPLNVADMVVLTKTQAFLAYRVGLALGYSTRWQDYVTEFGGVLGGGFLWRQLARSLVGLIPAWGIIPKVAVAYSGTYVVGTAILQWYMTGKHVTGKQLNELYRQAFERGKQLARSLAARVPKPRLKLSWRRRPKELPAPVQTKACPQCGQMNAADAHYCQYCGADFSSLEAPQSSAEAETPGDQGAP